jgi:predicted HD superfamily hydrolase involved in NAD metabolism
MDSTALSRLESQLLEELAVRVKPSRLRHSIAVGELAMNLCGRFGVESRAGLLAGLGHDILKDSSIESQWDYAKRTQAHDELAAIRPIVAAMESDPSFSDKIIHGPAASAFLFEELGYRDINILIAVAAHSAGATTMPSLSKIIYIADKLEPGRPYVTSKDNKALAIFSLDDLMIYALDQSLGWMKDRGLTIAQSTLDLYNALKMKAFPK